MQYRVTPLAENLYLVHFMIAEGRYDRFTTIEVENGDTLHVRGWAWEPLKRSDYYGLRDKHFPDAVWVLWERWDFENKTLEPVRIKLRALK